MRYPRIIRYILSPKWVGGSLYLLLPVLINKFWKVTEKTRLFLEYDTTTKKLTVRNEGGLRE